MRAWRVHQLGDPTDVMRLEEVEPPEPGPGEVAVDVDIAALNFPDILVCQGKYQEKPPLPFTPGLELAGTVAALGEGVTGFSVGQRVLGGPKFGSGALAERTLVEEQTLFPVPETMPTTAAAALYITYQTGHMALHHRGGLRAGETLLVHAGAGGVGSAAIQLGRAAGARVLATAGGPDKVKVCLDLGAEVAIDYTTEDFVAAVKDATGGRGADVIYDPVGGDTFDRSRKCVAFEGRILVIGFTSGRIADAPTNHALVKNYSVVGVHWGLYYKLRPEMPRLIHDELVRLHADGAIDPLVFKELPFEEAPAGLELLGARGTYGKVLVRTA